MPTYIDDALLPTIEELDYLFDDDIYIPTSDGSYIRFQQYENHLDFYDQEDDDYYHRELYFD